jgi:hypothetical protein
MPVTRSGTNAKPDASCNGATIGKTRSKETPPSPVPIAQASSSRPTNSTHGSQAASNTTSPPSPAARSQVAPVIASPLPRAGAAGVNPTQVCRIKLLLLKSSSYDLIVDLSSLKPIKSKFPESKSNDFEALGVVWVCLMGSINY